jgi:hypothetical protein
MQMLYDSDSFVVVHMQANEALDGEPAPHVLRHGFEIVDKRSTSTARGRTRSSGRSMPGS